jgi:hypothetical protein
VLALLAGTSLVAVLGTEFGRIWRLGSLSEPVEAEGRPTGAASRIPVVIREGMRVTATHENAVFAMLAAFALTFTIARSVTYTIRTRGGLGPIHDVHVGSRHIHHFVPGVLIVFASGGTAIATRRPRLNYALALPFGVGAALVLDEAALMLELEDVYWAEEGLLSIDIAFAGLCLLASLAYATKLLRRRETQQRETDWESAAKAWSEIQALPGSTREAR